MHKNTQKEEEKITEDREKRNKLTMHISQKKKKRI